MRDSYLENGFVIIPGVLTGKALEDVKEALAAPIHNLCDHHGCSVKDKKSWGGLHEALRRVKAMGDGIYLNAIKISQNDPRILAVAGAPKLMEALHSIGLSQPAVALKPFPVTIADDLHIEGGYNIRPWHQEWPVMQGSHDGVVAWMPLHDIDEEHNALELLPASHLEGPRQWERTKCGTGVVTEALPETEPYTVHLNAGDVVLFSAFTIHRTGPTGGGLRSAISIRYNNLAADDFQKRGYPDPSKLLIERQPLDGYVPKVDWSS